MQPSNTKRPDHMSDKVLSLFYAHLADMLKEHTPDFVKGMSDVKIINGLNQAKIHNNGYEFAKELEKTGWYDITAEVVTILDGGYSIFRNAYREIVKKWVERELIKPQFKEGDSVLFSKGKDKFEGKIVMVDEEYAEYVVRVPSMGHINEGVGTYGIILEYERCSASMS